MNPNHIGGRYIRGFLRPDGAQELTPLHEVIAPNVTKLPADLIGPIARSFYLRNAAAVDWPQRYEAQDWIREEVRQLKAARLDVAYSEADISQTAEKWAAICRSLGSFGAAFPYVESLGVVPPKPKGSITEAGIFERFKCARWWRRQLRKLFTRSAETHLREIGIVQKRKQLYASDRAVEWRRVRKLRDSAMLKKMEAVSDAGDQLELFGIVEKSQANPVLRRNELMLRARGFDEIAQAHDHAADFWTLTTPSAFHRTLDSGAPNPRYEGFTVRQAQAWLCKQWARVRAKLKRLSVLFYGIRIAEPHHDATPHWHALLFYPKHQREAVRACISGFWLSEYASEPGAREVRTKVVPINRDKAKGWSAAGYIAKYVAKNVDGFKVGGDYESEAQEDSKATVDRVAAWASAHGIRQFQQIGGPGVGVWRELRRLRNIVDVAEIEEARTAADGGEYATFITALGGIARGRGGCVQLWKESTGEFTQYSELRAAQVVGVQCQTGQRRLRGRISSSLESSPSRSSSQILGRGANDESEESLSLVASAKPVDFPICAPLRIRTREKCWRIQRKKEGATASRTLGATSEAGAHSLTLPRLSSLGPVSITVRDRQGVSLTKRTVELESSDELRSPSGIYAWIYSEPLKKPKREKGKTPWH